MEWSYNNHLEKSRTWALCIEADWFLPYDPAYAWCCNNDQVKNEIVNKSKGKSTKALCFEGQDNNPMFGLKFGIKTSYWNVFIAWFLIWSYLYDLWVSWSNSKL